MSRAVWVTRDDRSCGDYNIHVARPPELSTGHSYWRCSDSSFCCELFERIAGFRLKPGEGPIKVKIEVKRVK